MMTLRDKTAIEVNGLRRVKGAHRVAPSLYLLVRESKRGGLRASWAFRFEIGGKSNWMGLGALRDFTLAEAKDRARRARQQLTDGIDPLQVKRQRAAAAKLAAAKALTFGAAAKKFVETHRPTWKNDKHAAQWR